MLPLLLLDWYPSKFDCAVKVLLSDEAAEGTGVVVEFWVGDGIGERDGAGDEELEGEALAVLLGLGVIDADGDGVGDDTSVGVGAAVGEGISVFADSTLGEVSSGEVAFLKIQIQLLYLNQQLKAWTN